MKDKLYHNPKLEVRKSFIEGYGVFAKEDIKRGELLEECHYCELEAYVDDDNFHRYVLELDDATKILNNKNGDPVNFGDMSIDQFLQVREYIDLDQIDKILDMKE